MVIKVWRNYHIKFNEVHFKSYYVYVQCVLAHCTVASKNNTREEKKTHNGQACWVFFFSLHVWLVYLDYFAHCACCLTLLYIKVLSRARKKKRRTSGALANCPLICRLHFLRRNDLFVFYQSIFCEAKDLSIHHNRDSWVSVESAWKCA